jgi:uncharacterized iron-regulated membrane protein
MIELFIRFFVLILGAIWIFVLCVFGIIYFINYIIKKIQKEREKL